MRPVTVLCALLLALTCACAAGHERPGATSRASDAAALAELWSRFERAFNAGDAATIGRLYAADADRISADGTHVVGRPAIEAGYAALLARRAADPSARPFEAAITTRFLGPDVALLDGRWQGLRDGVPVTGHFTLTATRQAGRWLLAAGRDGGVTTGQPPGAPGDDELSPPTTTDTEGGAMERVTGLGGVFFRAGDAKATGAWYREHLGIETEDWGGFAFRWSEVGAPDEQGYTVWSPMPRETAYFGEGGQEFMVNYRVADLEQLVTALRAEGVEILGEIEDHPNGRFAWIRDPDGRRVELWQPVPAKDDPYL